MAFPEDVLTEDEHVVLHLHPHWKALIRPIVVLVRPWPRSPPDSCCCRPACRAPSRLYVIAGLALVAVCWLTIWPILVWRSTHYLFTNERVVLQLGVLSRERRDIPLGRINDHSMNQHFFERLLGCGTLTIESAGERGQSVLTSIPGVQKVQTTLYDLVETHHDKHSLGDDEMREIMADMREGKPLRTEPKSS